MSKDKVNPGRACGYLRIQKREDFETIASTLRYQKVKARESSIYRKIMMKVLGKRLGETAGRELVCIHLEGPNKGYPDDFIDYYTYDTKNEEKWGERGNKGSSNKGKGVRSLPM